MLLEIRQTTPFQCGNTLRHRPNDLGLGDLAEEVCFRGPPPVRHVETERFGEMVAIVRSTLVSTPYHAVQGGGDAVCEKRVPIGFAQPLEPGAEHLRSRQTALPL